MKYTKYWIVVAVSLGVVLSSASASAMTEILPGPTETSPISGTGISGKVTFQTAGGLAFSCKEATGTGEFTSGNDGKGEAHVTGCQSVGINCNSPGAKSGEIILKDAIHYWAGLLGGKLIAVAVALITTPLLIECPATKLRMEKKGCTAGQVPPEFLNKKIKSLTGTLKQSKGKQEISEILPPGSKTFIKCTGEISIDGKPFEEIGQEGSGTTENFNQKGKLLEIELMF
jgi:hypothetical protein